MGCHIFGIRHHGPGCARALRSALLTLEPDILLIEGPPDGNEALSHANLTSGMVPPVALLVHALDDPQNSAFYPFAEFSPEWQAICYGAEQSIPTRFMDLPCTHTLALQAQRQAQRQEQRKAQPAPDQPKALEGAGRTPTRDSNADAEQALRDDPIGVLAEAAGFADHEQWWDVQVEQRQDAVGLFEAILEAMTSLREEHVERSLIEKQREAHMRTVIRSAIKDGYKKIAVVCGAWHAPVLKELGPAKSDLALLKGLPKIKVSATWVPWTHSRLAFRSGYGAGVESPGWYAHVWQHGSRAPLVWATLAARLLRQEELESSSANVIETVRLADALAALRELPTPGLTELRHAIEAVLCGGEGARLELIRTRLEIGSALGIVPASAGQVPLMRDFEREVKRLRLKLTAQPIELDLDLRKEGDRDRSRLFHRLRILGIAWAETAYSSKGAGTFREGWQLAWQPELSVELIAANIWGNTVELAAGNALSERALKADLSELARLLELALFAQLPGALDALLQQLDERAATASDVLVQMQAILPLARLLRYGDVRATQAAHVAPVIKALFERVVVGLAPACAQLDDDAAAPMVEAMTSVQSALSLIDATDLQQDWRAALEELMSTDSVHPRIQGRACRILLEQRVLDEAELARRASLSLSASVEPALAARWVEGLVAGEGLLLVHQRELLSVLDQWLSSLTPEAFQAQLPLLRRALSGLAGPERRAIAKQMKQARSPRPAQGAGISAVETFDPERARWVLPVLSRILGVTLDSKLAPDGAGHLASEVAGGEHD